MLRAPERTPPAKAEALLEAHGWQLPPIARREGGLWMLPSGRIDGMREEARREGRRAALELPYDVNPLLPLYATPPQPAASSQTAEDGLCTGRLPTVECRGDGKLPPAAQSLIAQGMACVLRGSALFPAGCSRWSQAEFLRTELARTRCHVLVAKAASKRFKYWRDEAEPSTMDRVPGGYAFKPPLSQQYMGGGEFFERSANAASGECVYLQHTLLQSDPQQPVGKLLPQGGHIGQNIMSDLSGAGGGINHPLLSAIASAGKFGPAQRCQLFVGGAPWRWWPPLAATAVAASW